MCARLRVVCVCVCVCLCAFARVFVHTVYARVCALRSTFSHRCTITEQSSYVQCVRRIFGCVRVNVRGVYAHMCASTALQHDFANES